MPRAAQVYIALLSLRLVSAQAPGVPHGGGACTDARDCALGGECVGNLCVCDAWWTGENCTLLNLQRPRFGRESGTCGAAYDGYYSWGGRALYDLVSDSFHLFASFMCRHATLSEWTTVSSSAHFVSDVVDGPYEWFPGDCDAGGICTPTMCVNKKQITHTRGSAILSRRLLLSSLLAALASLSLPLSVSLGRITR